MSRHVGKKHNYPDEKKRLDFEILYKRYFNPLLNFGFSFIIPIKELEESINILEKILQIEIEESEDVYILK